jgi:hypothetical protein
MVRLDDGETTFSMSTRKQAGLALLARIPEMRLVKEIKVKVLYIQGFSTRQTQILAALDRATGGSGWTVRRTDSQGYLED